MANFREKKYYPKKKVFFDYLPPTNKNKIKTLKKSLFRQKFCLYTNCIYYTCKKKVLCKMPLILLKTLKNYIVLIFSVFL